MALTSILKKPPIFPPYDHNFSHVAKIRGRGNIFGFCFTFNQFTRGLNLRYLISIIHMKFYSG